MISTIKLFLKFINISTYPDYSNVLESAL